MAVLRRRSIVPDAQAEFSSLEPPGSNRALQIETSILIVL